MLTRKDLHDEIENFASQIFKAMEKLTTKEDLEEVKVEVHDLKGEVSDLKTEVKYLRNDVNDLKANSPTAKEFQNHEIRIRKLETAHALA